MAGTTSKGIFYPTSGDLVKSTSVPSKLASDMESLARSVDTAIDATSFYQGATALTAESDIDNLATGYTRVPNVTVARALKLPYEYPGDMLTIPFGTVGARQVFSPLKAGVGSFSRFKVNSIWSGWSKDAPEPSGADTAGVARGMQLVERFKARKGGVIGTGGKGAVALRFDDAPAEFRAKVLPLLIERNLPFTRVSTSYSVHSDVIAQSEFPAMQDYCLKYGGEVWNHGRTHGDAAGDENIYHELIDSLSELREAMPRIPIDCFAPPGGSVSYDGHMPSNTPENWATTTGKELMEHHAISSGYYPDSYYRPLDGVLRNGQIHYSVDVYKADRTIQLAQRARDWGVGVVMMWHAQNLDTSSGQPLSELVAALDEIAAMRDRGEIMVLTKSGLGVADIRSAYRDDILTSHSGASSFSETILYPLYRQNIPGSTRELTATVTADGGAIVTATVGEVSRDFTVPESGTLQLRYPVTIPKDVGSTLRVSISAPCTDVHMYAV